MQLAARGGSSRRRGDARPGSAGDGRGLPHGVELGLFVGGRAAGAADRRLGHALNRRIQQLDGCLPVGCAHGRHA